MTTFMNPETDMIMAMYDLMKRRIYAYMNALMHEGPCLSTPLGPEKAAQARSLAFSREFWVTNVVMNGVLAKSWQPKRYGSSSDLGPSNGIIALESAVASVLRQVER